MKRFLVMLLVFVVAMTSVLALEGSDLDLYLYGKAGVNSLRGGNGLDVSFGNDNSSFGLYLSPELLMYFDGSNGLDLGLSLVASDSFGFGMKVGYTHLFEIVDDLDMALNAGFQWNTISDFHTFAIYVDADFLYTFYDDFFFTFGATNEFPFANVVKVGNTSTTDTFFSCRFILPRVGFGYRF